MSDLTPEEETLLKEAEDRWLAGGHRHCAACFQNWRWEWINGHRSIKALAELFDKDMKRKDRDEDKRS